MKQCSKCGELKEVSLFSKGNNQCKECMKQYNKQYYHTHRKELKKYRKQYCQDHKEEIKKYRHDHREERKQYDKQYHQDHKEGKKQYDKQYRQDHKDKIKQYKKQYVLNHKEEIKQRHKQYDKQYRQSESGKIRQKRSNAKKRNMKYILIMNNPFPCEIDEHHILNNFHAIDADNPWNKWFVIPMPMITHRFIGGNSNDLGHWRHNGEWIRKLYDININELLGNTLEGR